MKLADYLAPGAVLELSATARNEALREVVEALAEHPAIPSMTAFYRAILERENLVSTGIGFGIAIPHAKIPGIQRFVIGIGRSINGIDYPSIDDSPVHIIVMIGGPEGEQGTYLKLLSTLQKFLKHERDAIIAAPSTAAIEALLKRY